jgi:hypothetical protein
MVWCIYLQTGRIRLLCASTILQYFYEQNKSVRYAVQFQWERWKFCTNNKASGRQQSSLTASVHTNITSWTKSFWEAGSRSAVQEIPRLLWIQKMCYSVHKISPGYLSLVQSAPYAFQICFKAISHSCSGVTNVPLILVLPLRFHTRFLSLLCVFQAPPVWSYFIW